ncbi:MAG TPA: hypothetical protein VNX18_22145 [Bryobacteraceae bacterium]|nr:hypothetical protein [Bryobacteraceae bacterium]
MHPNFTGEWRANLAQSKIRGAQPKQVLVAIEQDGPRLIQSITMTNSDGREEHMTFRFSTDGQETMNSLRGQEMSTRARWADPELVIETVLLMGDREGHFRDHWSLAADGKTLRMAHVDDDLAGQVTVLERTVV